MSVEELTAKVKTLADEIKYYKKINAANLLFNKFYGKYGLEQLIGMGSFGQVYKAIDYTKQHEIKKQIREQKTLSKTLESQLAKNGETKRQCAKTLGALGTERNEKKDAGTFVKSDARAVEMFKKKKRIRCKNCCTGEKNAAY